VLRPAQLVAPGREVQARCLSPERLEQHLYRQGNPREVVDLLWSMFLGLVHLSETRENLGLGITTPEDLHARAFEWFEAGLRRRSG
jgi:hypothetical protein